MRTTETYAATVQHTEQPTKPRCYRWEVWVGDGETYRLMPDQHLNLDAATLADRPLRGGWGRLVITREDPTA